VSTETAREAFDDWAAGLVDAFDAGDLSGARLALLVAALKSDGDRDRTSVWLAFSAGWVSAMTHARRFAVDEGALIDADEGEP